MEPASRTDMQHRAPEDADQAAPESPRARRTVATFGDYTAAQAAVDRLSDEGFPVDRVVIVGHGLRSVEHVTGRRSYLQAAGSGAASGAVVGAFLGAVFGLLTFFEPLTSAVVLALWGLVFGALVGALFGLLAHAMTGGRRDFSSVRTVEAERYDIDVDADHASDAERRLAARI